jgi:nucleotide-binding universal stress UspA family protein
MKKFLAVFDGLNFSDSTMQYAIAVSKQCNAHLVGLFLDDSTRHSYGVPEIIHYKGKNLDRHLQRLHDFEREKRVQSVKVFEEACSKAGGLNWSVHRSLDIALQVALHELIYADLLIISSGETLTHFTEKPPTRFIRDLLSDVQCPVLLVPSVYNSIDEIILLYDGSPSSVYAVRAFSYVMDGINNATTQVITVKEPGQSLHLPDGRLIKEFVKRHYPDAKYNVLTGDAEEKLPKQLLKEKKSPVVVLGAYRRNRLSRLFKPSMADNLLEHIKMPLFIAHSKT